LESTNQMTTVWRGGEHSRGFCTFLKQVLAGVGRLFGSVEEV